MKLSRIKYYSLALSSLLALGLGCSSDRQDAGGGGIAPPKDIPVVNEPVVKYNFYEPATEEGLINDTNYGYLIAKVKPGFKTAFFERLGLKVMGSMAANGSVYYRLHKDSDVLRTLNQAKKHAGVMFIEPEFKCELHADVVTNPVIYNNPDTRIADKTQDSAFTTKAYDAWLKYGFGDPDKRPVVASVDTGVRWRHQDLIAQVRHAYSWYLPTSPTNWTAHVQMEGGGIPYDGERMMNLLPDLIHAYNGTQYYSTDTAGHGTHTSGTICATGNNGVGVAGISWNNELVHYKAFNSGNGSSNWSTHGSIWHLARWKEANNYTATIPVNASWGSAAASQFSIDMITHGLQNGIVVVASAGNNGTRQVQYPAAYSGVIAVGGTTGADRLVHFSCWGPHVSVVAPGASIVSTYLADTATTTENNAAGTSNSTYSYDSGTSMSAPHVTGLIGYMLNFNPNLKPDQIKTYIEQNADFIDGETGFSDKYGWGRINVLKTIEAVINDVNNGATPPSNYASAPVKVKVSADIPVNMNGLGVFLYNCSTDGAIENYVASAIIGESVAGIDPDTGMGGESNIAWFNMLKPGRYVAKTYIGVAGTVASTEPFTVAAGQSQMMEVELGFGGAEVKILTIQTFPTRDMLNSDFANICDPEIGFFNSNGDSIAFYDQNYWDSLVIPMPGDSGDYYIQITDYNGNSQVGEYALWVTTGVSWTPESDNDWITDGTTRYPLAPGTFASPAGGAKSAQAQSRTTAQAVSFNNIYYGRFNGAAADGGTSGATGHWYKFTVN